MLINIATHVHDTKYFFFYIYLLIIISIYQTRHISCVQKLWNNINILFFHWKTFYLKDFGILLNLLTAGIPRISTRDNISHLCRRCSPYFSSNACLSHNSKVNDFHWGILFIFLLILKQTKCIIHMYYYSNTCCTSSLVCSVPMHGHF